MTGRPQNTNSQNLKMSCDSNCTCSVSSGVSQTLDELDFNRGIWFAAQYNDQKRVEELLQKGICVDVRDTAGYTALHYASRNGHLHLCRYLIDAGADVDATTRIGHATSLHRATSAGQKEIVNLLLAKRANVDTCDADGKNILHRAVQSEQFDLVKMYISKFPHLIRAKDQKGKTAAEYASVEVAAMFNV